MPPLLAAVAGVIFAFVFGLAVGGARRLWGRTSGASVYSVDDLTRDRE